MHNHRIPMSVIFIIIFFFSAIIFGFWLGIDQYRNCEKRGGKIVFSYKWSWCEIAKEMKAVGR